MALASWSKEKTVKIWDAQNGRLIKTLSGFKKEVQTVAFSPDGAFLAAGDWSGLITIWNVQTWDEHVVLHCAQHGVARFWSLAFSPNGKYFAASGEGGHVAANDGGVLIWDAKGFEEHTAGEDPAPLRPRSHFCIGDTQAVCFSSDSRLLAALNTERRVQVWDVATEHPIWASNAGRVNNANRNLVFYSDNKYLGYNAADGTFEVWDIDNRCRAFVLRGEGDRACQASLTSDSGLLARRLLKGTSISIWNAKMRRHLVTLPPRRASIWSSAWAPDGRRLAVGYSDGEVAIWDIFAIHEQLEKIGLQWPEPPSVATENSVN